MAAILQGICFGQERMSRCLLRESGQKIMCATVLGKVCASDHAMNAVDEMSALNRDLKQLFDENGASYPVWQELKQEAEEGSFRW